MSTSAVSTVSGTSSYTAENPPASVYPASSGAHVATAPVQVNMPGKILLAVDRGAKFEVDATGAFFIKAGSAVTVITNPDQYAAALMILGLANVPSHCTVVSAPVASEHGDNKGVATDTTASNSPNTHEASLITKVEQLEIDNDALWSIVDALRVDLDTKTKEADTTADQLRATKDELEVKATELQVTKAEFETLKDEFHKTKDKLVEDIDKLEVVNDALQKELVSTQCLLEETKASLQATRAEVRAMDGELGHTEAKLQEARTELSCAKIKLQAAQTVLSRTRLDLSTVRSQQRHAPPSLRPDKPIRLERPSFDHAPDDEDKITITFILADGPVTVETTKTTTLLELTKELRLVNNKAKPGSQRLDIERFWMRNNAEAFGSWIGFEECNIKDGATVHLYHETKTDLCSFPEWV